MVFQALCTDRTGRPVLRGLLPAGGVEVEAAPLHVPLLAGGIEVHVADRLGAGERRDRCDQVAMQRLAPPAATCLAEPSSAIRHVLEASLQTTDIELAAPKRSNAPLSGVDLHCYNVTIRC